jgi:cholesterol transport system auxiliary component
MSRLLVAASVTALTACRFLGSQDVPKTAFDFGPPEAHDARSVPKTLPANIIVANIVAPGWMDGSSMYYRLTYRSATNPLPYANSRWVMSPAALLTQRLRWLLGGGSEGDGAGAGSSGQIYVLRGELVEFEQIFDRPDRSRGVLRLRATLEGQRDGHRSQRTFEIEKLAPTPDAAGGVKALSLCADELSNSVTEWVADQLEATTALRP